MSTAVDVAHARQPAKSFDARARNERAGLIILALGLGALWFICCRDLSEEWRFNEQYSYGWFVPFFGLYLFFTRWEDRPAASLPARRWLAFLLIAGAALLLLPLRVFEIASSDYRPLSWLHASAAVTITLAVIYSFGGSRWLRHFAFPVVFMLAAVPWPTFIEGPIIEGLMRGVASAAAETVSLFGIPAEATGNIVQLPSGAVGVNEACSGVRSLQTAIMIGLLFGELRRLRLGRRALLLGASVGIALLANFLRVVFLVSLASSRGTAGMETYHDAAGYGIVILVFFGTMWIASRFGKTIDPSTVERSKERASGRVPLLAAAALLFWLVAIEVGAEGWYRMHERDLTAVPAWSVSWPEHAPDYRDIKIDDRVRNLMRFDLGREAVWSSHSEAGKVPNYLFFFRWNAGQGTILRARAHRPDICMPSAGWKQVGPERNKTFHLEDGALPIAFKHFEFSRDGTSFRAHAYYCLREDQIHGSEKNREDLYSNWDFADRWRVVKNGIRNLGQQVLQVIVVTPADTDDASVDRQVHEILNRVIVPAKKSS